METHLFESLLKRWPDNTRFIDSKPPVWILSKYQRSSDSISALQNDFVQSCPENTLSLVFSLEMMHVYFRLGSKTYDYRPHRGPFSGVSVSDYRSGKTDRMEVLFTLSPHEKLRFLEYIQNIQHSRETVLGKAHALSLTEPDFTVRSHQSQGKLEQNRLLNSNDMHNCLTWFTLAPLGLHGERVLELLEMMPKDLDAEVHSYIVAFYRFLVTQASSQRIPGVVYWTQLPVQDAENRIRTSPDTVTHYYSKS